MKKVLNANFKYFLYLSTTYSQIVRFWLSTRRTLIPLLSHFGELYGQAVFLQDVRHDLLDMTIFYLELYSSCTTLQVALNSRISNLYILAGENQVSPKWS